MGTARWHDTTPGTAGWREAADVGGRSISRLAPACGSHSTTRHWEPHAGARRLMGTARSREATPGTARSRDTTLGTARWREAADGTARWHEAADGNRTLAQGG